MLQKIMQTDNDFGATIARIVLGVVMLPHGLQKLLGMFGGYGFSATVDFFTSGGIPLAVAVLVIVGESFGALGLIIGLFGRVAAAGIAIIMAGAIFTAHLANGFFMNWFGNQQGEGYEYHLLAIGLALVVAVRGSGAFSIDRAVSK
ncbi:MAG: DoxX family protein [Deltaproteobacteria bacterium]